MNDTFWKIYIFYFPKICPNFIGSSLGRSILKTKQNHFGMFLTPHLCSVKMTMKHSKWCLCLAKKLKNISISFFSIKLFKLRYGLGNTIFVYFCSFLLVTLSAFLKKLWDSTSIKSVRSFLFTFSWAISIYKWWGLIGLAQFLAQ